MAKEPCEICKDRISRPALRAYRKEQDIRVKLRKLRAENKRLRDKMDKWIFACSCSREFKSIISFRNHQRSCDGVLKK